MEEKKVKCAMFLTPSSCAEWLTKLAQTKDLKETVVGITDNRSTIVVYFID